MNHNNTPAPTGAPGATDAERAAWLADKIAAGGDYAKEAQAWYDANNADPLPTCHCGRPSNIAWMGGGACSQAHYRDATNSATPSGSDASQQKGGA